MLFRKLFGNADADSKAQDGIREAPSTRQPTVKTKRRKEIFIALAGAGETNGTVRNDGKFAHGTSATAVGVLTYFESDEPGTPSPSYFKYMDNYSGPPLDPVHLEYKESGKRIFDVPESLASSGLFRVLSDSLPQQQGRKRLSRQFPETEKMRDVELLAWMASGGGLKADGFTGGFTSGALLFFTKAPGDERPLLSLKAVNDFGSKTVQELAGIAVKMSYNELAASIVHGGARSKTTYFDATGEVGPPGVHYIVKFNAVTDAYNNARVEHGTQALADLAGIKVARSLVVGVMSNGVRVADMFLTERYDRFTDGEGRDVRQHRISMLSLMDGLKVPTQDAGDYRDVFEVIRKVSADPERDTQEMFKRILFNIAVNNTDDHLKNHEMLCDSATGKWSLAPAYDLVPNDKPYPHATCLAGYGNGSLADEFVKILAARLGITEAAAFKSRDDVAAAVAQWRDVYVMSAECGEHDLDAVQAAINLHGVRAERLLGFARAMADPVSSTGPDIAPTLLSARYLNGGAKIVQLDLSSTTGPPDAMKAGSPIPKPKTRPG